MPGWLRRKTPDFTITPADVIVYREGDCAVAVDGKTKNMIARSTDHAEVIQKAINHVANKGGGKVYIKAGTYTLSTDIVPKDNVAIVGSGYSTVLTGRRFYLEYKNNIIIGDLRIKDATWGIYLIGCNNITIKNVFIENIQNEGIKNTNEFSRNIIIRGCRITNCAEHGIVLYRVTDVVIEGNFISNCGLPGVTVWSSSGRVVVANNVSRDNNPSEKDAHGFIVGGESSEIIVIGNVATGNGGHGIEAMSSNGRRTIVLGNICTRNGLSPDANKSGIYINFNNGIVAYNISAYNNGGGITVGPDAKHILIIGNLLFNNGHSKVGYYYAQSGIYVNRETPLSDMYLQIIGNIIYDDQNTKTQLAGVYVKSGANKLIIAYNTVHGHPDYDIYYPTENDIIVYKNKEYITENSGTATLSGDGSTTDFLIGEHGLSPSIDDPSKVVVKCTPASPDAIAASPLVCYLSDEDTDGNYESIRVKFSSAPPSGTDNVKVVWEAEYVG